MLSQGRGSTTSSGCTGLRIHVVHPRSEAWFEVYYQEWQVKVPPCFHLFCLVLFCSISKHVGFWYKKMFENYNRLARTN